MNSLLNSLNGGLGSLLLAGALLGGALAACDPKTIGDETAGDAVCKQGEQKPADDGCNTCTCEGGEWACTELACECKEGETKPADDGCNTCGCIDGQWACTLIGCGQTSGGPAECVDGETMPAGDGCNTCTCYEGQWACTEKGCGDTTGGAECVDGDMKNDGCNDCVCVEGGWVCTDKACPAGCGDGKLDVGEQCDDGNSEDGDGCAAACTLEGGDALKVCAQPYAMDQLFVVGAKIVADTMIVDVEASGGCEPHEFAYCWDGLFLESFPVQIHTQISHDGNGDPCEAIVSETLEYDLTDLKKAYQDGYKTQNGEIVIHLSGWDASLSYVF